MNGVKEGCALLIWLEAKCQSSCVTASWTLLTLIYKNEC